MEQNLSSDANNHSAGQGISSIYGIWPFITVLTTVYHYQLTK
jgi:hypothetical protein